MINPLFLFSAQIVAIVSVLLLAIGYIKTEPKAASARVFGVMAVFIAFYIIQGMTRMHIDPVFRIGDGEQRLFIQPAIDAIPGLFMIYCFLIFQESRKFPLFLAALFFIQVLADVLLFALGLDRVSPTPDEALSLIVVIRISVDLVQLSFVAAAIYWTLKGWRSDLVEDRRALRWFIISVQGGLIFLVVLVENVFLLIDSDAYANVQAVLVISIALIATAMLIATMRFDYVSLAEVVRKVVESKEEPRPETDAQFTVDSFNKAFSDGKLYREAGLTIAMLAKKLNLPEYRLRAFIHKELGFRNFNAMLHQYRIEDASLALADKQSQQLPVLTIALSVGYQSITPFNNAFRQLKGVTPSEYRKQNARSV